LETQLLLAARYLKEDSAQAALALHAEVERMLDSLIRSLKLRNNVEALPLPLPLGPFDPLPLKLASVAS
jgi:hypothetical protein